jgi:hypothetical protein
MTPGTVRKVSIWKDVNQMLLVAFLVIGVVLGIGMIVVGYIVSRLFG